MPSEIITAIFGRGKLATALIWAIFTLPRRWPRWLFSIPAAALNFAKSWRAFLLYVREQGADLLSFRGSFAGAFGMLQFLAQ